jgi:hypothetical protein
MIASPPLRSADALSGPALMKTSTAHRDWLADIGSLKGGVWVYCRYIGRWGGVRRWQTCSENLCRAGAR